MAQTESMMLKLGTKAPDFRLPDAITGKTVSLSEYAASPALVVIFMCNHCPFVKHVREGMVKMAKEFQGKGVGVAGINSNDVENFPDDSPEKMKKEAIQYGYTFAYLYDETQETAKAYRAACTPDFYLFDKNRRLVYRGQMDSSRPGNGIPVTGEDLRRAVDAVLSGKPVNSKQRPSMGCNIKWKPGNEPGYFGG